MWSKTRSGRILSINRDEVIDHASLRHHALVLLQPLHRNEPSFHFNVSKDVLQVRHGQHAKVLFNDGESSCPPGAL